MIKNCSDCEFEEREDNEMWCTNTKSPKCGEFVKPGGYCPHWAQKNANYGTSNRRSV